MLDGHGDAHGLENLAACTDTLAANCKAVPILFNERLLKGFKILFDLLPLEAMSRSFQAAVEFFLEQKREETAKHMTPYGLVEPFNTLLARTGCHTQLDSRRLG